MPGTHLLPPNLLKLFAPRPPLPWLRAVGKDIDRVTKKDVSGVAHMLAQLKEANTETLITSGEAEAMEEGEEPIFTHAEEIKRQIRREERKAKRTEEFKIAKETCTSFLQFSSFSTNKLTFSQINLRTTLRQWETHTKPFLFPAWYVPCFHGGILPNFLLQHKSATETDLRREFEGYGTIERVRIVRDKKGRSRGYAFVVYERERDMKGPYLAPSAETRNTHIFYYSRVQGIRWIAHHG
jgi:U1 small nuclear ribonucleoprotein